MTRLSSLRDAREFRRVLANGRRGRSDGVTVFATPARDHGRVGIVVPQRVGHAVVRNRMKRRVRAIVGALPQRTDVDMVVRLEPAVVPLKFQELENHLVTAFERARGAS